MNPIFLAYAIGSVIAMVAFIRTDLWPLSFVLWWLATEYLKMAGE